MKIQYQRDDLIVFESALFRTTTSLIIGDTYVLLIDPNWLPIELDFIQKTVEEVGEGKEKYLLFTHSDYDHIIGYGQFKEYTTIASKNFINNPSKENVLRDIAKFDDEYYVKRAYSVEYPRIDKIIAGEKEQWMLGLEQYTFFQATGHNADGLFLYNHNKKLLIAGDYLSNVEFPYIYHSVQCYLDTLLKFENLLQEETVSLLVAGHGDVTSDTAEMFTRIKDSQQYIKELVESVTSDKDFEEAAWLEKYDFPIIMKQFHLKNIELATREFKA